MDVKVFNTTNDGDGLAARKPESHEHVLHGNASRVYLQERVHRRAAIDDPFADILGAFSSGRGDIALNHDHYLYDEDLNAERQLDSS